MRGKRREAAVSANSSGESVDILPCVGVAVAGQAARGAITSKDAAVSGAKMLSL